MTPLVRLCIAFVVVLSFWGCSKKDLGYDKPAEYWYKGILREIRVSNLEGADDFFSSLQSEHVHSPLVPEAMLILGRAHMNAQEYLLAEYYFEEYLKRFGTSENADFIGFLKLQANFFAFSRETLNQQLLLDSIALVEEYRAKFPDSRYKPYADTMLLKLQLANLYLNKEIARIYRRQDKDTAAQEYLKRSENEWFGGVSAKDPRIPWYRQLFNW
ncbi:MAG: outer membrane protein assembly factor BamD [Wolinella sp.]